MQIANIMGLIEHAGMTSKKVQEGQIANIMGLIEHAGMTGLTQWKGQK